MKDQILIDLGEFNKPNNKVYSGQKRGKELRQKLNIKKYDKGNWIVTIKIPEDTYSLNPSFFLGFLGKSVKFLGEQEFKEIYRFECTETIMENIEEGIKTALKYSSIFDTDED